LYYFILDYCVEETVRIENNDPNIEKNVETLTKSSLFLLNLMKDCIDAQSPDTDIEELYRSVEEFAYENNDKRSTQAFCQFYKGLQEKIEDIAELKQNKMQILAKFLQFTLKLKKTYNAELQYSKGSLLLKLTFSSERGYDLYMQDFEKGEIGRQILSLLLYPPFLANFDLQIEDLVVYLNDEPLNEISK
jgi:hypothetical protein